MPRDHKGPSAWSNLTVARTPRPIRHVARPSARSGASRAVANRMGAALPIARDAGGAKLPEREDEVLELLHRLDTAFLDSESIECAPTQRCGNNAALFPARAARGPDTAPWDSATCSLAGHLANAPLLRWLEDQCASGEWYAATAVRILSQLCWSERCQADLCASGAASVWCPSLSTLTHRCAAQAPASAWELLSASIAAPARRCGRRWAQASPATAESPSQFACPRCD